MPKPRHASSYSLSPDAKQALERLSLALGIPRNKVLELSIRLLARRELPAEKKSEKSAKGA